MLERKPAEIIPVLLVCGPEDMCLECPKPIEIHECKGMYVAKMKRDRKARERTTGAPYSCTTIFSKSCCDDNAMQMHLDRQMQKCRVISSTVRQHVFWHT